jgi:hypothetical protein
MTSLCPDPLWVDVAWEQFEYLMKHQEDTRFSKLYAVLMEPFADGHGNVNSKTA